MVLDESEITKSVNFVFVILLCHMASVNNVVVTADTIPTYNSVSSTVKKLNDAKKRVYRGPFTKKLHDVMFGLQDSFPPSATNFRTASIVDAISTTRRPYGEKFRAWAYSESTTTIR